ncbi:hypothetical protein [Paraburkholderia sp. DHOC27]|uniref:hypothetical protein n=1 Tax=Paraburkholderia sp. DHOC27 TaxID=2303330 RepID=UPI0011C13DA8|nr:hypothetical protein [Paraburkholderia sp. DHOC27]
MREKPRAIARARGTMQVREGARWTMQMTGMFEAYPVGDSARREEPISPVWPRAFPQGPTIALRMRFWPILAAQTSGHGGRLICVDVILDSFGRKGNSSTGFDEHKLLFNFFIRVIFCFTTASFSNFILLCTFALPVSSLF